jgi:hypothetical protein
MQSDEHELCRLLSDKHVYELKELCDEVDLDKHGTREEIILRISHRLKSSEHTYKMRQWRNKFTISFIDVEKKTKSMKKIGQNLVDSSGSQIDAFKTFISAFPGGTNEFKKHASYNKFVIAFTIGYALYCRDLNIGCDDIKHYFAHGAKMKNDDPLKSIVLRVKKSALQNLGRFMYSIDVHEQNKHEFFDDSLALLPGSAYFLENKATTDRKKPEETKRKESEKTKKPKKGKGLIVPDKAVAMARKRKKKAETAAAAAQLKSKAFSAVAAMTAAAQAATAAARIAGKSSAATARALKAAGKAPPPLPGVQAVQPPATTPAEPPAPATAPAPKPVEVGLAATAATGAPAASEAGAAASTEEPPAPATAPASKPVEVRAAATVAPGAPAASEAGAAASTEEPAAPSTAPAAKAVEVRAEGTAVPRALAPSEAVLAASTEEPPAPPAAPSAAAPKAPLAAKVTAQLPQPQSAHTAEPTAGAAGAAAAAETSRRAAPYIPPSRRELFVDASDFGVFRANIHKRHNEIVSASGFSERSLLSFVLEVASGLIPDLNDQLQVETVNGHAVITTSSSFKRARK